MSTQISLGDGAILNMQRDWILQGNLEAGSAVSTLVSIPDVSRVRGGEIQMFGTTATTMPTLIATNGNRLIVESDVVLIQGQVGADVDSVLELAGNFRTGGSVQVTAAGTIDVSGTAVFEGGSFLIAGSNTSGQANVRVVDGGRLEMRGGSAAGALSGDVGLALVEAGGTLRFEESAIVGPSAGSQFALEIENHGRVEVQGAYGTFAGFGQIGSLVGDYTQADAGTLVSTARTENGIRSFGALGYQDAAITLDGSLDLRLDAVAAADPSVLFAEAFPILLGISSMSSGADAFVAGTFDAIEVVSDLTGEAVVGVTADVSYNEVFASGLAVGVVTSVTFSQALALSGDFNGSGRVEQGDLNLVLNGWGDPRGAWSNANNFATTNVDQEELNAVLNNWGASGAPSFAGGATVVPEPGVLALVGLGWMGWRRRGGGR